LVVFGRKPVQSFLETRRTTVEQGIAEGTRLKAAAEAKHREYTERIAQIDEELAKLRADILQAARTEKDRIIADAEERAKRLRIETDELISQQMQQLQASLSREVVGAAVAAAEKMLQGAIKGEDQARLAQDYVTQVSTLSRGGRA
jgi:F0F1-type ATP synthase membrane subunit b/b'